MVTIRVERHIAAAPDLVFAWLAEPVHMTAAPLLLRCRWVEGTPDGAVGSRRVAISTGMRLIEEITAYDPPRSYSYRIVQSFPAFDHEGGTLTFTPTGDGTHVGWVSVYTHPPRGGGKVLEAITSRLLPWNFRAVLERCATELEP